jgi:predicted nucleotidyltransferase
MMEIEDLLDAVTQWARTDSRVLGLALVGSHARNEAGPDSDVDLVVLSDVSHELLSYTSWAEAFGIVTSVKHEEYGRVTSVRVRYAWGFEVEFGIAPVDWASVPVDPGTRRVMTDGARVLYDCGGHLARALEALSAA